MSIDYKSIGKRIKTARIRLDMTQERLAEQVNLSPSHLSNIEDWYYKGKPAYDHKTGKRSSGICR